MNLSQKLLLGGAAAAVLGGGLALGALRLAPVPAAAAADAPATAVAQAQAERQGDQLAQALQAAIDQRLAVLRALAAQPGTARDLQALAQAQAELPGPTPPADAALHDEMLAWLATRLGPDWARAEQRPLPDLGAAVRSRSPASAALQQAYVVRNPQGPGEREALDRAELPGRYADLHAQVHPAWRTARRGLGFDDLLLIDTATDTIVYSVAKDPDFATSLVEGLGAASALAETYARVRRAPSPSAVAVSDTARYLPAPADWVVFAAVPVFEGERQVGVLAGRVRLQALTAALAPWNDQAQLVGADGWLRSVPAAWAASPAAFADTASAVAEDKRELARHRNTPVGLLPPLDAGKALPGAPVRLGSQGPVWQLLWQPEVVAAADAMAPALAWWPAVAGTGVAMVLAGAGLAGLGRRWQAPLAQVRDTLERAAQGDTQARSRIDTPDEWGELGAALDRVLDERGQRLQQAAHENDSLNRSVVGLLQTVFQMSNKDLTARAEVTEDIIGTLSSSINQLGDETSRTLHEVQNIAEQVRSACEFVGEQAVRVDETAQEERAALEGMAASLNQATYQLAQMAALSTNSSEAAELASAATDAALQAVDTTVRGMESLRGAIAETEKRFKRLGERSQEISTVVNLINAIAERTHVLSLNASMQASNAGEAGRSFAVVAEEVQRLSESARQATGQIAQLVQSIQVETGDTLLTMNRLIAQVVKQSEQARHAGAQMTETRDTTAQLVSLVQQIAAFSQAQSTLAHELRLSVDQLNRGSAQTILAIEQQTESTATLVDYARRLSEAVGQFRLPPPDDAY